VTSKRADWLIPAGLIALSAIPLVAGAFRLGQLGAADIAPGNARFLAAPVPIVLHIISAAIYGVAGAFQFAPGFRRRNPGWHRAAGWVLIPCGLVVAVSGLWMTQFYDTRGGDPPASFDGPVVYVMRLVVGSAMAAALGLAVAAIRRRDVPRHRAWMMRGYALALGAGTQVFTHLPWFLVPSIQGAAARALFMGAGWAINLAVAEWLISRQRRTQAAFPAYRNGNQYEVLMTK